MASTAIPAVKAAILAALEGAEALQGVAVTAGKEPERDEEWVWVWKAEAEREFKMLGPSPAALDEVVKITLRVVSIQGANATPSEERAFEIAEAVETALRADPDLGEAVHWQRIEKVEQEPLLFDKRYGCLVLMVVKAKARI